MPKIGARRNPDTPDVHEVVTKVAERNPQKLRQIGLNYDIANAKGLVGLTEEEQKQKEMKKRDVAEKKRKEKEAADKDKADFEAWKKEEKEEYEAWKKERKRLEEKTKAGSGESETVDTKSAVSETKGASTSVAAHEEGKPAIPAAQNSDTAMARDATLEAKPANTTLDAELVSKTAGLKVDDTDAPSDNEETEHTSDEGPKLHIRASSRPVSRGRRLSPRLYGHAPRNYYGDEPPQEAGSRAHSPVNDKPKPWNAVCVLGLRVYSQDSEVSIKLVKPKSVEEGAILDVGGDTAAGATM